MNFHERVKTIVDTIDPGIPILKLSLTSDNRNIKSEQRPWSPEIPIEMADTYLGQLVLSNTRRERTTSGYHIDVQAVMASIRNEVIYEFTKIYTFSSENSMPARTKLFKDIKNLQHIAKRDDTVFDDIFAISEYFNQVTAGHDGKIRELGNETNRKNIVYLIKSLVRKYGNKNSDR